MSDEFATMEAAFEQGTRGTWAANGKTLYANVNGQWVAIANFASPSDAAFAAEARARSAPAIAELRAWRSRSGTAVGPLGNF